jgi:SRSO17 transposase
MSGASVEQVLGLWSAELGGLKARIRPLFAHPSVAASAAAFVDGLLGPERRKTGWMRAEAAGDPGPWRQQAVLGRSHWDADALRDLVREYAVETLAASDAVLVIDETGFLKQGNASCGVKRQYTGSAGKITNCQIGGFAAYVSGKGHAFIDRRLYLPREWTDKPTRLAAAHVPAAVPFATKPRIAVEMIGRAIEAGVPFAWVAADSVYGVGEVETAPRRAGKGYVLSVIGTSQFWSWGEEPAIAGTAEEIAAALPASRYVRLSAGDGAKGPRLYDWAYLELADLDAEPRGYPGSHGVWTRGLLIRRSVADQDLAFFTTWVPAGHRDGAAGADRRPPLGHRGRLRDRQDRTRPRPQRDQELARLAPSRLAGPARLRQADGAPPQGGGTRRTPRKRRSHLEPQMVRWSVQEIRRVAGRLAQRRIEPALVIAWSAWRRCHQAMAQQAHLKQSVQL